MEEGDDLFYYNTKTHEKSLDHPCDKKYKDIYKQVLLYFIIQII